MDAPGFQPVDSWVVPVDLRHERVVWLAARPDLVRIHRKWWHAWSRIMRGCASPLHTVCIDAQNPEADDLRASLQTASVIVDALAPHFSARERESVRRTGVLPDWFWSVYLGAFEDATKRR